MNVFQFFIICKRTNNANNATHYVKLGKKRRESSKRNYYIISPRAIIKAIITIPVIKAILKKKSPISICDTHKALQTNRYWKVKFFPNGS